ncbi:MAG: electron transfer flavoprotein subunit alpha [Chloroflexi bacterium]|nr:electron transfer flavoprotein subunit alpha [Chloroflexota bacterium]
MVENKKPIKRPLGKARLIPDKCIACGARCQSDCRSQSITMNEAGEPIIDTAKCTGCRRCVRVCPAKALEMFFTPEQQEILAQLARQAGKAAAPEQAEEEIDDEEAAIASKLAEYKGVWVYVEQTDGQPASVSWELLGAGANLAKTLGVEVSAVVIGEGVANLCQEAISCGASKVYLMESPIFRNYRTEPYYKAVCYLVEKYKPEIVLVGATGLGRDLAGAVATELGTGLTADCTGLDIDEKRFLLQTRPAFGGNIMATIMTERTRPQMATVRPHVLAEPERNVSRTGEIIRETMLLHEEDIAVKVLETLHDRGGGAEEEDIAAAEIIVAGGRGMQSADNFHLLQELADELGGTVASSRSAVEAGWMPVERQVGQTGKTVRPKIYFAFGISGAIQHLVGMQDSDVIIAVNRDPQAPIFEVATYGIVGDLFQVVPAITNRIRELRKQRVRS